MNIARKTMYGRNMTEAIHRPRQSDQDALASALTCLRWHAKDAGLSFSQAVEQSWTEMVHDRVNKEDS